ncbi:MAG: BamA/TamA family outer membrane protein [Sphingomonas bacterium]|nr:BamA/TamA family outer membrane protein [Sphingomonas bacterium]
MTVSTGRLYWLGCALAIATPAYAQISQPGSAPAQGPDTARPKEAASGQATIENGNVTGASQAQPDLDEPIIPQPEFDAALPPLSNDIDAPLEAMPTDGTTVSPVPPSAPFPKTDTPSTGATNIVPVTGDVLPAAEQADPELVAPLTPIGAYDTVPLQNVADAKDKDLPQIRYETNLVGLDDVGLESEFNSLSALKDGGGKAANATQVQARAKEDEALAVRLMKSLGYYDGSALSTIVPEEGDGGQLQATVRATPGPLYTLSSITVKADPVVPTDLIRQNLPIKVGDAIDAARIQGAEANVALILPQQGYPFVKVGQRDILLDDMSGKATGAYTLPVDTGPRSTFGNLVSTGDPVFGIDHLNVFPRFDQGELYDARLTDDLRDALVATGLFSTVSVEPQQTGRPGPNGTEQVDLLVRQVAGPARTLAGQGGFSTGQGFKVEGSWTHRNLFPPEGALIGTIVAGSQEQGASGSFRRSNAGRRDRTFTTLISANHSNYDAFNAFTGTIAARWSYDSTPIWQKPLTYYYGGELVGTNESVYDFGRGMRVRRNYGIVALPGQVQFDRSDNLLNPTKGYRLKLNVSPETAVSGGVRPYVRTMIEGTYYYDVSPSLVIAGRARAGAIFGIDRDDLAPSRRYYGGGGGSVRGYGYQRLGPFDPNGDPVGGRSLNEFALEARYRFGDFGIVPFIDAGNSYESTLPKGSDLRFGAGIGGRFYTNFGPLRVDVATPLNKRPGDSRVALYISIGQAF